MTQDQWLELKEQFERARDASAVARSQILHRLENTQVRDELEELLRAYDDSGEFLERPAIASSGVLEARDSWAGQRLGNYRLVRQIGEGGMGVVYEATRADGEFEQRVAIKIVKFWLSSQRETERFRAERQILARLDHPNIARLIDGGTTSDGLPFLAMEFVDGRRIDEYANVNKLDVSARLQLFRQVCEAVDYAHAQGIVHRDLKPGNILVTATGRPKLLDFGIAKVLDLQAAEATTLTLARQATPLYASPEHLRGEPTTPASDIYSLGVLLYELITNESPYAGKHGTLHTISRAVHEQMPRPPSEVLGNRAWKRNLDRVVAVAMQKDPAARYSSVQDLIADLDRFLAGTEVAKRHSTSRRGRQHKLVWLTAMAVLSLAGWFVLSKNGSLLRPQSAFEQLYAQGMERLQHFDWPTARSLFRRAVDADPHNPMGHYAYSAALHTLGYESLAQREAKLANDWASGQTPENQLLIRGRYQEFTHDTKGSVATYEKLSAMHPNNADYTLRLASAQVAAGTPADALRTLASIPRVTDPADQARIQLQKARAYELQSRYQQELEQAHAAAQTADRIGTRELKADALQVEGDAFRAMNQFDEAVLAYSEAEALSRETGDLYAVASIENRLGGMYFNKGDYSALEAHSNTALALFRQIDNKTAQSSILNNLSLVKKSRGDLKGALDLLAQAVSISRDADDLRAQARELTNEGTILRHLGRNDEARKTFEEALLCGERIGDRDQIARSHITLEQMNRDDGNLAAALAHDRTAITILQESKSMALKSLAWQHLGDDIHASGDLPQAKAAIEQSLAAARQANSKQLTADDSYMLADVAREQRAFQQATDLLDAAEAYYVAQKQDPNLWDAWVVESRLQIAMGQPGGSEKKLAEAVRGFEHINDQARACNASAALIESFLAQRRMKDAAQIVARSHTACGAVPEYEVRVLYKIRALQTEAAAGSAGGSRNALLALGRELRAKGWGDLARVARAAADQLKVSAETM